MPHYSNIEELNSPEIKKTNTNNISNQDNKEDKILNVKWKSCGILEWYKNEKIDEPLFVVYGSEALEHGYFEGYLDLTQKQLDQVNANLECYYHYGKVCNLNNEDIEDCECILGRENSSIIVEYLCDRYESLIDKIIIPLAEECGQDLKLDY